MNSKRQQDSDAWVLVRLDKTKMWRQCKTLLRETGTESKYTRILKMFIQILQEMMKQDLTLQVMKWRDHCP